MSALTQSPQWKALESHATEMKKAHLRDLFSDPSRFSQLSIDHPELGMFLDYSKNIVTGQTLALLRDLASSTGVAEQAGRMFSGEKINWTEDRAVLHIALRNRSNTPIRVDGVDVMPAINDVLARIKRFTTQVRDGSWKGATGKTITDVINIGIGGSDLGPLMVCTALQHYADGPAVHFVSNVDGTDIAETLKKVDPGNYTDPGGVENLYHPGNHDQCTDRPFLAGRCARPGRRCPPFRRPFNQCRRCL